MRRPAAAATIRRSAAIAAAMSLPPLATILATVLLAAAAPGQKDVPPPPRQDPFTAAQDKAMAALGVVSYGPFPWADGLRNEDIDRVLGDNRILWLETAHFRIGSTLKPIDVADDVEARKEVLAECAELHKRLAKLPVRPKKLDAWYRLHLYAQRAETMYGDFARMAGSADGTLASGPFLGLPGKYLLLLFEKKSDLSRYMERFAGRNNLTTSTRHFHEQTKQELVVATAEDDPPHDEAALHSLVNYLLASALTDGLDGRTGSTPEWLRLGIAHCYERQVTTNLITVHMNDSDHVDQESQHKWREKMYARAQHETLLVPFADLKSRVEFGFYEEVQAWSRVDFLRSLGETGFGAFLLACKRNDATAQHEAALQTQFGFDGEGFDHKWREWVLKTYK